MANSATAFDKRVDAWIARQQLGKPVVFVYSDIKGSTEIGDRLANPQAFLSYMVRHHVIFSEVVAAIGGRIAGKSGDGILCVFDDSASAIAAAFYCLELRNEFAASQRLPLRLRFGIHPGRFFALQPGFEASLPLGSQSRRKRVSRPASGDREIISFDIAIAQRIQILEAPSFKSPDLVFVSQPVLDNLRPIPKWNAYQTVGEFRIGGTRYIAFEYERLTKNPVMMKGVRNPPRTYYIEPRDSFLMSRFPRSMSNARFIAQMREEHGLRVTPRTAASLRKRIERTIARGPKE